MDYKEKTNGNHQQVDTDPRGQHKLTVNKFKDKAQELKKRATKNFSPPGGFDDTPVPQTPPGFTIQITFHRATHLPIADLGTLSSDPFVLADLQVATPTRHKEDPPLQFRTPTVRRKRHPVWDATWIVANIPRNGFKLKARIYDEDRADSDDRLGNAYLAVGELSESWPGIQEQKLKIKKRMGSKRAYLARGCAAIFIPSIQLTGELILSVNMLGPTESESRRVYTVGPQYWSQHFSSMIGMIAGTKPPGQRGKAERYNFEANQFQLRGPVPDSLYHRFVEFKPFIHGMFVRSGLRGHILNRALHHQHVRVYNYDHTTLYGEFWSPSEEMTLQFLNMVHFDLGGRLFTYVLTLDGLLRFTETGKEFGIDLLSKHSMHADVSIYIAFSGEFFVRRVNKPRSRSSTHTTRGSSGPSSRDDRRKSPRRSGRRHLLDWFRRHAHHRSPTHDPSNYELIIDNSSGTYRPSRHLLPTFESFLRSNFPGLNIRALDCNDEQLVKMKAEQLQRKKKQGVVRMYVQDNASSIDSSISSSDEDELEERVRKAQTEEQQKGETQARSQEPDGLDERELHSKHSAHGDGIQLGDQDYGSGLPSTSTKKETLDDGSTMVGGSNATDNS